MSRQFTSLAVDASVLMDVREMGVQLRHPERILEYLAQYPELVRVIPVAVQAARTHFPEAQLVMALYQDPEIAEDRYLVLYVRPKTFDGSVLERLEKAESAFGHLLEGTKGWLQITTDFGTPEDRDGL